MSDALYTGAILLASLALIFIPLELTLGRRRQPLMRPGFWTDMAFFWGQQLLFVGAVLLTLDTIGDALDATVAVGFRAAVAAQPLWLQIIEVVLLCDVVVYWGHRLSHRVPFLWRFHRVHHTSTHLDWLAGYREHPFDGLYTMFLENLPALILGFPLSLIAGFIAFRGLWAVFIHSNTRIRLGPLECLLGSPQLHHWHHDAAVGGRVNFANLSPLMDILFGTYHNPKRANPGPYGLPSQPRPDGYLVHLARPFVPGRRRTAVAPQVGAPPVPTTATTVPANPLLDITRSFSGRGTQDATCLDRPRPSPER